MTFSFGAPGAAAASQPATGGFSFGATPGQAAPTQPAAGGFSFGSGSTGATAPAVGTVKPTPAAGSAFGAAATSTAPAAVGAGFSFGSGAAAGAAKPATTTAAATGFGGFSGFGAAAPTTAAASTTAAPAAAAGFTSFGGGAASTSTAAGGFGGFGAATATTQAAAPAAAGFGLSAATTQAAAGFGAPAAAGATTATAATTATLGLGGNTVAPSFSLGGSLGAAAGSGSQSTAAGGAASTADQKPEVKNVKDAMIPVQLDATVEQLKKHIKEEKSVCSDISHFSDKTFSKIKEETEALSQLVTVLSIGIQKNRSALDKLKLSSAQELLNVEIAQRTRDIPASMQYENVAPMEYFVRLVTHFEADMNEYRKQIDQTQHQLQLLGSGAAISSGDISQAVQKLHSVFTDLAARYQVIHQTLIKCKEQYMAIHRRLHGTSVPAFDKPSVVVVKPASATAGILETMPALSKLSGPSPFSAPSDPLIQARQLVPNKSQVNPGIAGPPTLGLNVSGTPAGAFGGITGTANNTSLFGAGGANNTSFGGFFANKGTTGFGGNTSGFVGNTSGFGGNTSGFGGNTSGFGGNTSGFGGNTSGFGGTSAFGQNSTFGSPGFGSSTGIFGNTSFGSPAVGTKRNKV